jgi:uncharacterized membrane protein YeiH
MLELPVVVETAAVVIGALSGAGHAVKREADIIGIFVIALSTSVGGGIIRDVLLGAGPPVALVHPRYLEVVGGATLVALLLSERLARLDRLLGWLDALLLGLWTLMGAQRAQAAGLPATAVVFLGTVTATGGGVMRDIFSGERPKVFVKGELHVTAAALAATLYALLVRVFAVPDVVAEAACLVTATVLRLVAMRWHLTAPAPRDLRWRKRS